MIPWSELLLIVGCTVILSIVMSILPSIKAGKSSITEVLSKN